VDALVEILRRRRPPDGPFLVGITGGVAVGKSTFTAALAADAASLVGGAGDVAVLPSDSFLFGNAELERRGLTMEKGFPASYDVDALRHALAELAAGRGVAVPSYSHRTYDIDPDARLAVAPASLVLVEGLHLTRFAGDLLHVTVHLDADERDVEEWYVARFVALVDAAGEDTESFYRWFRGLDPAALDATARQLWSTINLVNLREHITPWRDRADVVVRLGADHEIAALRST
jgi:type I pantothenate kinase